jgi:putative ABC transport system substrate-binding protein
VAARGACIAADARYAAAFRKGLNETRYFEAQNVVVEYPLAGRPLRSPALADLVRRRVAPQVTTYLFPQEVDVLITHGTPGTRVAKQATTTIPIVMAISGDAIATGLVSSLARPEANLTGSTFFLPQLNAKRLELLKEACPRISRPAALSNPNNPVSRPIIPAMQAAAASLGLIVEVARAQSPSEFSLAFGAIGRVDSVVVPRTENLQLVFERSRRLRLRTNCPR